MDIEEIPGGFKVNDASGQTLAYVYAREETAAAAIAKVLTMYEARRIAANNFDRIKAGDDIVASYYEEIAVIVTAGPPAAEEEGFAASEGAYAAPPATEEVDVAAAVAPKGAEPGAAAAEVVTIETTIEAVEYDTRIVTLAGQNGLSRRVKVGPAVDVDQLKEGDAVTIQITEAVAVDVQIP